jgi:hypothetical protein
LDSRWCFCLYLELQWPFLLPYSSYRDKLTDERLIRVAGIAEVEETGQFILVLKDFSLEPPHLSIEVRSLDRDGYTQALRCSHRGLAGVSCPDTDDDNAVTEALFSTIGNRLRGDRLQGSTCNKAWDTRAS